MLDIKEHNEAIDKCAYLSDDKCTPGQRKTRARERQICTMSFPRFMRWCMIVEPPTLENAGGVIPFEMWPHTRTIIKTLLTKRLITILKSRQIGASWIVAAYVLWYALHKHGANILLFSRGQTEAIELLGKCIRIYNHLPRFMQLKKDPDSTTEIGFPFMESHIQALAATETAGISFTASVVVCDEHEEHPYAGENYLSSKPTIDNGGQFISIFTVNKNKASTLAKSLYLGSEGNGYVTVAKGKGNGYTPLFFPYTVRPGRDQEWYEQKKREIPKEELKGLTPELFMEQNYPRSVEEALRPSSTVSAFDFTVLSDMLTEVKSPIKIIRDGLDLNICHIYKEPFIGEKYIVGTDTSHGVGQDYSVTAVMNVRTGEVVADLMDRYLSPEELALQSTRMLAVFDSPLWFIETNDWGQVTLSRAQTLGYKRLGGSKDKKGTTTLGYRTNIATRPLMWNDLQAGINSHQITIHNADGIRQFMNVIRNIEKEGRIEAKSGSNDDYPMAVGIAWYKRDKVPLVEDTFESIASLTFRS